MTEFERFQSLIELKDLDRLMKENEKMEVKYIPEPVLQEMVEINHRLKVRTPIFKE